LLETFLKSSDLLLPSVLFRSDLCSDLFVNGYDLFLNGNDLLLPSVLFRSDLCSDLFVNGNDLLLPSVFFAAICLSTLLFSSE
jgi:hypothetical protein